MTTNPVPICSPPSSQYTFSHPLSWSNNCEVAQILSDIPFISVGILAFGVSVLFLIFQRLPFSSLWLYSSAFLAFAAVMLDLGQTVANEVAMVTTLSVAWQLIRAREILLALSTGFRFLFYWSYVAEPPHKAGPSTLSTKGNFLALHSSNEPHGGDWNRWGMPGRLLRIGLLAAIAIITALQIVWRVVPQFHRYSNVYATDTVLELLVSFLLILKLLVNTITPNSPDIVLVHTFKECFAPICGLLMNIAIGVGNLLCFAFTESTVGRLLQAVEIYTIVIFVVIIALLKHRKSLLSATASQRLNRTTSNFRLPHPTRGSIFHITPPVVETPRMSMIVDPASSNNISTRETLRRSARHSLNQVSSWLANKVLRNGSVEDGAEARLWEQDNTEKGKVDPPYTGTVASETRASLTSLTEEPKEWADVVQYADATHMSIMSALDAQSAIARSMEASSSVGQSIAAPRVDETNRTVPIQIRDIATSFSPTHSPDTLIVHEMGIETVPKEGESPIYTLDGNRSAGGASNDSRISLDELLRQQEELDQTIEALKRFATRTSNTSSHSSPIQSPGSAEISRFSSSTDRRTASDVSLSNFPIPPWLTTSMPSLPPLRSAPVLRTRGDRRPSGLQSAANEPLVSPPVISHSPVDIPSTPRSDSIPYSPLKEDSESLSAAAGRSPRFDSGGTQYNVTSFIGGLALPDASVLENTGLPSSPAQTESDLSAIQKSPTDGKNMQATLTPSSSLRVMLAPPSKARFSLHSGYPGPRQGQRAMDDPALFMQRHLNQQIVPSLMITPSPPQSRLRVSTTAMQDGMLKLPTNPRTPRDVSTGSEGAEGTSDRGRRVFKRIRPPPLVIQSYSDYRSRNPPAQDAGG